MTTRPVTSISARATSRTTTTPTNTRTVRTPAAENETVLVLNSFYYEPAWKPALLIDSVGRQEELDCFSHDDNTEAYHSKGSSKKSGL